MTIQSDISVKLNLTESQIKKKKRKEIQLMNNTS